MRSIIFFFAFILCQVVAAQATGSVYGRVTDVNADGEPLIFASVALKDLSISGQTNFHGNFEITGIPEGSHILQVNYLGYESKEIPIQVAAGKVALVETSLQVLTTGTESLLLSEATPSPSITADKAAKQ